MPYAIEDTAKHEALCARVCELEAYNTTSTNDLMAATERMVKLEEKLRVAEAALVEMLAAERMTNRPPETVIDAEAKLDRIRLAATQCVAAIAKLREQPEGQTERSES